jgi:hypothetical protein
VQDGLRARYWPAKSPVQLSDIERVRDCGQLQQVEEQEWNLAVQ